MWTVQRPQHAAGYTYRTCAQKIRDRDLRSRVLAAEHKIADAEGAYTLAAEDTQLHSLKETDFDVSNVTRLEMANLYSSRLARKASPGRFIYDAIKLAPMFGRCPLCGHRQVETLDHHLPKSQFSALAVTPLNLVPTCSECNFAKQEFVATRAEDATLHPYFDDICDDMWLDAEVVESIPVAIRFFVNAPHHWPLILRQRVVGHFDRFGLAVLYTVQAAHELSSITHALSMLLDEGGADQTRRHLARQAESRRVLQMNSWQTATYAALCKSDWFCSGGWRGVR